MTRKGRLAHHLHLGVEYDNRMYVQSRRPLNPFTRERVRNNCNWLLYWLVNGSAREPTKDVPSCEKPEGAARRLRTQDLRMGIPTTIANAQ